MQCPSGKGAAFVSDSAALFLRKEDPMLKNMSLAIFVMNEKARVIGVQYDSDLEKFGENGAKITNFKTLDPSIAVNDFVVIETGTRHGFTVAKVREVDKAVNLHSEEPMRWIACKIDVENHNKRKELEKAVIAEIEAAQNEKLRREMRDALIAGQEGRFTALPLVTGADIPVAE
jgi:hypothetical protein